MSEEIVIKLDDIEAKLSVVSALGNWFKALAVAAFLLGIWVASIQARISTLEVYGSSNFNDYEKKELEYKAQINSNFNAINSQISSLTQQIKYNEIRIDRIENSIKK